MPNDVIILEITPPFYAPPNSTSPEEEDEWLVYQIIHPLKEQLNDVPPSPSFSIEHQSTIVPLEPTYLC